MRYVAYHGLFLLLFTQCATSNASRHFKSPLAMGRDAFKPKHASSVSISEVIDTGVNSNLLFTYSRNLPGLQQHDIRLHSLGQAVLALCRFITGADLVIIKQIIFANFCWRKVWHNDISSCENSLFPSGWRNRTEGGCCREKYFRQHKTDQPKQVKCQFQCSGRFTSELCIVVRDKRTNSNHMRIQFF